MREWNGKKFVFRLWFSNLLVDATICFGLCVWGCGSYAGTESKFSLLHRLLDRPKHPNLIRFASNMMFVDVDDKQHCWCEPIGVVIGSWVCVCLPHVHSTVDQLWKSSAMSITSIVAMGFGIEMESRITDEHYEHCSAVPFWFILFSYHRWHWASTIATISTNTTATSVKWRKKKHPKRYASSRPCSMSVFRGHAAKPNRIRNNNALQNMRRSFSPI